MEYLLAHFPRTSPLHARLKAQADAVTRRGLDRVRDLSHRRFRFRLPRLLLGADRAGGSRRQSGERAVRLRALPRRSDRARAARVHRRGVRRAAARLVPHPAVSGVQGESRAGAAGAEAAVRPVPLHVRGARHRELRQPRVRGGRHHRHARDAHARRGAERHRGHARQGPGAADPPRRRVLGLHRRGALPLRPDRASASACSRSAWPASWR